MFSEIGQFLWAVGSKWIALLTGGFIMAAVTVFERYTHKSVPKAVNRVILAVTLMVTFFLVWQDERHRAINGEKQAAALPARQFTKKTAKQLIAPFASPDRTEHQAKAIAALDQGKWITVTANLVDVSTSTRQLILDFSGPSGHVPLQENHPYISVPLSSEQLSTLAALPKGTAVTVTGKIESIESTEIHLTEGSIDGVLIPTNK